MIRVIKVTGNSLTPEYQEGDFVALITAHFLLGKLKVGDAIVFHHETYGTMIKKIARIKSSGELLYVTGSHPLSVDSNRFGPIRKDTLIGKVIWHIRKPRQ
jgi:phage repressor protein C with HTH and peptisase S24 domain